MKNSAFPPGKSGGIGYAALQKGEFTAICLPFKPKTAMDWRQSAKNLKGLPRLTFLLALGMLGLSACTTLEISEKTGFSKENIQAGALTVAAYSVLSPAARDLFVVGLVYLIADPLAPNWSLRETRVGEDTFQFEMDMKAMATGGEGASLSIIKRRARYLQEQLRYSGYRILEHEEGIDSSTFGPHRYALARIQLQK